MTNFIAGRTKSISKPLSLLLFLITTQLYIHAASAQVPTPGAPTDDEVNAIARQLYCPVCENTPLDVCPTQACAEWRGLIREKLTEGWSEEQIKQYFVERFGDRVLATPPPHGLNWMVYIVPPIAFLVGAYLLLRAFASWGLTLKRISPQAIHEENPESHATGDEFIERLEEELRKL
jgi:cytochrome c-type biogenesis protein CcmH